MAVTKYIYYQGTGYTPSTIPSDFISLVSLEALGGGGGSYYVGSGAQLAGGGGGAYSKTLGSSITVPMVAGVTPVYFVSSPPAFSSAFNYAYIQIGDNAQPTSTATGV